MRNPDSSFTGFHTETSKSLIYPKSNDITHSTRNHALKSQIFQVSPESLLSISLISADNWQSLNHRELACLCISLKLFRGNSEQAK